MKRTLLGLFTALAVALIMSPTASAQILIAQFDENTYPVNPAIGFGAFTFGAMTVTETPTSLILNAEDSGQADGAFGGVGVDFGEFVELPPDSGNFVLLPFDFDPNLAWWEFRLKKLPGNEAGAIRTTIRDMDVLGVSGDEHVYEFDLASVPDDDEFHTLIKPFTEVLFTQDAFGFPGGDGILNPGLDQVQIQSVWGATERLHVEVDFARVMMIPEPGTLAMVGLGSLALWMHRRRRVA